MSQIRLEAGQVWKNELGYLIEILAINSTHFCWRLSTGELGCSEIIHWKVVQNPVLVK
jgi:hypothetical protein